MESGKFNESVLITGNTYEVHGNPHQSTLAAYGMLYCAYTGRAYTGRTCDNLPPPHPPRYAKSTKVKKTIMIVSLSKKCKEKKGRNIKLNYSVVTQVVITLPLCQCNVSVATEKVTKQVGYDILLDSKCLPVLTSEGTSGLEFWKSTRKILAASWSVYEQLTGKSPKVDLTDKALPVDLTCDDS